MVVIRIHMFAFDDSLTSYRFSMMTDKLDVVSNLLLGTTTEAGMRCAPVNPF